MKLSKIVSCALIISSISYAKDSNKDKTTLDDVIVTGNKIEKNLQETVSSIQVFDDTFIENSSNLADMFDFFEQTPGVNQTGRFTFNIRGINTTGITGTYFGPRTIDVLVDGVSLGSNASKQGAISTWDVKQVEIIKGPQATTQGRNSLAGAVIIKTKDPEFDANGAFQTSYGTNNTYQISAMQTGAVSDNLALRLSVDQQHTDGFVTNDSIRKDKFNKRDVTNVRAKALYKFSDDATALLTLSQMHHDEKGYWQVGKNKKSIYNTDAYYDTKGQAHSLELNFPISDTWALKSISSYARETLDRLRDIDNLSGTGTGTFDRENKSYNQEFRFTYNGEDLKSVIGLYHSQGKGTDDVNVEGASFSVAIVDSDQYLEEKFKNTAIFFNSDYHLSDSFTLIFGARLDRDTRENTSDVNTFRTNDLGSTVNAIIDAQLSSLGNGNVSAKTQTTNFMPKLGFNYKWNENINTGFLFSKGYRPGGMSTNPISGETKEYEKEYTNNFELSFKSQWLEKRLLLNANLYHTKWKNQQVSQQGTSISSFDVNTINAGKSTLKGLELNSKFLINDNIDIYGNIGYSKATFNKYIDNNKNYSGNTLKKTPKITGNIGLNVRTDDGYFMGGNVSYTGSQYADDANERKLDAFTLVNVKVGYEENDWSLYVYANNLFDKDYIVNRASADSYEYGDERVVGVNFKYYW